MTRVAYVMPRFPVLSQTFVTNEILEMRRQGTDVEIFPLLRQTAGVLPTEAQELAASTHYIQPASREVLFAHWHWLRQRPRRYLGIWASTFAGAERTPRRLLQATVAVSQSMALARRLEREGIEHIHAHFATHSALAAWSIRRLTGIPYSVTAHSYDITVQASMLDAKFSEAKFAVVVSRYYQRFLGGRLRPSALDKIHVVHCGVDLKRLPRRPARAASIPATVLCPARLHKVKGHRFLISAVAMLAKRGVDLRLQIAGDGELLDDLKAQAAEESILDRVEFLGQVSHTQMLRLMVDADLVVLPSATTASGAREGIPVSLMEAMAVGAPVVATSISGVPELVEDGVAGLLVPERDVKALADAIERVLLDEELAARLVTGARRIVETEFALDACSARIRELIEAP